MEFLLLQSHDSIRDHSGVVAGRVSQDRNAVAEFRIEAHLVQEPASVAEMVAMARLSAPI